MTLVLFSVLVLAIVASAIDPQKQPDIKRWVSLEEEFRREL